MTEQESSESDEQDATAGPDGDAADARDAEEGDAQASEATPASELEDGDAVDDELVERVASADPKAIARDLATLELEVDGLEAELEAREEEIEDLTSKLKRKQADFENYKKRMKRRREEEAQRATEDLVTRLLDVRDNLRRALDQEEGVDVRDGVESTLRQFDDVLAAEDVDPIEPEPGEEVDPHRHEVLARVESEAPEGAIADVHRPGYAMGDAVLREAQVTVSEGATDGADGDGGEGAASEE